MLAKYALAHVSLVSAFFTAACEDSSSSLWMLASVNLWGSIFKSGLVIGLSGCSLLLGVLSYDFSIAFFCECILCPRNLSFREVGEISGEEVRRGFSKMIPQRVVLQQCV